MSRAGLVSTEVDGGRPLFEAQSGSPNYTARIQRHTCATCLSVSLVIRSAVSVSSCRGVRPTFAMARSVYRGLGRPVTSGRRLLSRSINLAIRASKSARADRKGDAELALPSAKVSFTETNPTGPTRNRDCVAGEHAAGSRSRCDNGLKLLSGSRSSTTAQALPVDKALTAPVRRWALCAPLPMPRSYSRT